MQYFSHTLTTKRRTTKRWHNPSHNFKRHFFPNRVSNYTMIINKVHCAPLYIERWVEPINWFYNPSNYKGERITQGEKSRLRESKKEKLQKHLGLSQCYQLKFKFSII
jgi:hypothetical protein